MKTSNRRYLFFGLLALFAIILLAPPEIINIDFSDVDPFAIFTRGGGFSSGIIFPYEEVGGINFLAPTLQYEAHQCNKQSSGVLQDPQSCPRTRSYFDYTIYGGRCGPAGRFEPELQTPSGRINLCDQAYEDSAILAPQNRQEFTIKEFIRFDDMRKDNLFEGSQNVIEVDFTSPIAGPVYYWAYVARPPITPDATEQPVINLFQAGTILEGANTARFILPTNIDTGRYIFNLAIGPREGADVFDPQSSAYRLPDGATGLYKVASPILEEEFVVSPPTKWKRIAEGETCPDPYYGTQFEGDLLCALDKEFIGGCADPANNIQCPITTDPVTGDVIAYSCNTAGICTEDLFRVENDPSDCDADQVFNAETSTCVSEEFEQNFLACTYTSDCVNPCPREMSVTCQSGACVYDGSCLVDQDVVAEFSVEEPEELDDQTRSTILYLLIGVVLGFVAWRYVKRKR